jgi:hypothetical protein
MRKMIGRGAMALDEKPDYELDAYLHKGDRRGPLCDVRLWLPKQPSEDGRVEVSAPGVHANQAVPGGLVELIFDDHKNFHFEARQVLVRSAISRLGGRAGGARLTIAHIGYLKIRHGLGLTSMCDRPESITFFLSATKFALPQIHFMTDYRGSRTILDASAAPRLVVQHPAGFECEFRLERFWNWTSDREDASALGRSAPVFSVEQVPEHPAASITALSECAEDAALLLSLAARWRVTVHGFAASASEPSSLLKAWRDPLARARAHGLEEGAGRLVAGEHFEAFFTAASKRFAELTPENREGIRHAIVIIHPTSERTIEGAYVAKFFAFEGLVQHFGRRSGTFAQRLQALLTKFPPQISGLWPVIGTPGKPGLYWLRNELAHGGSLRGETSGALVLASDHLQLWIEYTLLAILAPTTTRHRDNWLADQVLEQREEIENFRELLGRMPTAP